MRSSYVKLFPAIILCCLCLLIYSNSFQNSFHFDDFTSITDNPAVRHIGGLRAIWDFWPTRFITYLSIAFNYWLGGYNVFGYHVFNFLIHLACGLLVWRLALLTGLRRRLAFFAAAIFLAHPIQTQAVNYIIQRAALLAAFFYLASLYFYVKARLGMDSPGWKSYYAGSILCGLLGCFSKEMIISLPITICLYEYCFFNGKKSSKGYYVIPYFFLALIVPLTMALSRSVDFQGMRRVAEGGPGISSWHYLLTQPRVIATYLRLLFVPSGQNLDHYYPPSNSLFEAQVLLGFLLLALILSAGIMLLRKNKLLSFCIFSFFVTLLPESSIIPIADVIFEHRLYLPMAFFSIFLAAGSGYLLKKQSDRLTLTVLSVLLAACTVLSYQRNKIWKDEFTLWNDAARKSPLKARPYVNRGQAYQKQGKIASALADYNRAIAIKPTYAEAFSNRGLAYQDSGDLELAITDYNKAVELNPKYAEAYVNRGIAYAKKGESAKALADFSKAMEALPGCAEAYVNRGTLYANKGALDLAVADYDKAIALNPHLVKPLFNRGLVYQNKGRFDLALRDYSKTIKIDPGFADAYINRAWVYFVLRQYAKAWDDAHKAQRLGLKIDPAFFEDLKKASGAGE